MPTNFEIHIWGVALCFYKEPYWNIIFPCNAEHHAKACFNGVEEQLYQDERVILIDFPIGAIEENSTPYGTSSYKLFNMSAHYAHGVDPATGASNLNLNNLVKMRDPIALKYSSFVWVRVPHATMYFQTPTACRYYVQDASGEIGLPVTDLGIKAREAVLRFTAKHEISLAAEDLRDPTYSAAISSTLPPTGNNIIEIDNDCHTATSIKANDFLDLYKIVSDVTDPKRKFAAGQMICADGKPPWERPSYCFPTDATDEEIALLKVSNTYGNCDPVESYPPPGP